MYSPDFQVSVNASPVQFRSDEHTTRWIECLQELELDGSSILIEITEGILLEDNTDMQTQLEKLKAVGMQFALDDFGTGYSSLAYLKIFPVDYLKIDRSFIHNLGNGSADMFLCELILMIGNKFGMKVVAEGVETIEQYKLLNQLHCHYVQGYYFSKPDSPEVIESLFSESFSDPDQIPVSRAA